MPDTRSRRCPVVMPVRFGMIGVCDVAAGVSDLLSAQRLDWAPRPIGSIHDRGDPGATPPGERLTPAGRPSSAVLGRPRPAQRPGPTTAQDPSPTAVRHPQHALTLALRRDHTTRDHLAPAIRAPAHVTITAQGNSAPRQRESWRGIPAHRWRTRRHGPPGRRLHGLDDPHTRRNRPGPTTLRPHPEPSSCAPTRVGSWRVTSSTATPCSSPGCPASPSSNTPPAEYTASASPHLTTAAWVT